MKNSLQKSHFILYFFFFLFITNAITAQTQTYGYAKIGGGGYVCSIVESLTEQNVFYAKTDVGGIFRWNESTKDWKPLFEWVSPDQTSFMGTEAMTIDPNAPNKIYAVAGTSYWNNGKSALLRSNNYGDTWEVFETTSKFKANGNGSDRQKGETLAIDPANGNILYFGTRYNNGLFRSTDAGQTWNKVTSFPDSIGTTSSFSFVQFDYNSATENGCSTIIVGNHKTGNNVHISTDFGATWKSVGGHNTGKPQRCALSINDNMLYVTYAMGTGAVKRYNLLSKNWSDITPASGRGYSGISVILNDPTKIVCSSYNYWSSQQEWGWGDEIYYSSNGGGNWTRKNQKGFSTMLNNGIGWMQGKSMHWVGCVTMSNTKPGLVYAVSGNGIFMTEDIRVSSPIWKVVSQGLEETVLVNQGMISIPDGPVISTMGDVGGFVHTDINQYPTANIAQSVSFAYAPLKTSTIVRSVNKTVTVNSVETKYNIVSLSEDNGKTWTELPRLPVDIQGAGTSISADGNIILWRATSTNTGSVLYWTVDKGVTWNKTAIMPTNATPVPDGVDPLKFYLHNTANGYIYRSDDGAKTFKAVSYVGATGGSSVLKTIAGKAGHVWINNAGKVRYSTNEGVSFTACSNYACSAFALGKEAPGSDYPAIYIWGKGTSTNPEAMYRSVDKGATWIRANDDMHQWGHLANAGNIEADKNVYGRVYKSTAGMGIPWMGLEGFTAVENIKDYKVNVEIFPTVFTNSCTLKSKNSHIKSVSVYNLQGALVESIATDMYNNESIELGSKLQKGAYLVKVTNNLGSSTYKIVKQ